MQELMNKVAATISDTKSGPGTRVLVSMVVQTLTIDTKTGDVKTDPGPESLIVSSSGSEGALLEPETMPHNLRSFAMIEGVLDWHMAREIASEAKRIGQRTKKEFTKETGINPDKKDIIKGSLIIVNRLIDELGNISDTYRDALDGGDKQEIRGEA